MSRDQAKQLAEQFLCHTGGNKCVVDRIVDLSELTTRHPTVYGVEIDDTCWIACVRGPSSGTVIKSSDIIVLSKEDGRVLYFGSANDEG